MHMKLFLVRVYVLILATAGFSVPAFAYLDPGTGSLILQSLVGAIAAAGAVVVFYYRQVKHYLSKVLFRRDPNRDSPDQ